MKKIYLFIFFTLSITAIFSQTLSKEESEQRVKNKIAQTAFDQASKGSGNQIMTSPEQDCNSAIPVCQYTYTQSNSYSGYGNNSEIPSNSSCLGSDEKNSVWYVFTVQAGGTLAFNITPNQSSDDYDFALYDISGQNCSAISNGSITPIRCNFSATAGTTGLSSSGSNASEPASGSNQSTTLNVTTGQTYVLVVSNYSSTQYGYTLQFSNAAGSANIFDNTPPTANSVTATCGSNVITMNMSEPVLCSSVTVSGSEFGVTGTGGPYTVSAASGVNCGTATSQVNITLNTALSGAGPWTLNYSNGTDGNVMIDNCGNLMPAGSVNFPLSPATASISGPTSICHGQTAGLTASSGNSWSWSGPAGFTSTSQSISVTPTTTSVYTVTISYGACGTSTATHTVTVKASPTANFTMNPNPVCAGSTVTFTNTSTMAQACIFAGIPTGSCPCSFPSSCSTPSSTGTFASYQWSFGDGGVDFYLLGSGTFSPTHTYSTPGTYQITLNASDNFSGCSNSINQTITVLPGVGPLTASNDTTVCPGQPVTMHVSGGSTYSWTSTPAGFTSTSASPTVTPTVTTTYNVASPGCGGSITEQVVVTIGGTPPVTSAISGPTPVCPNATGQTYSVTANAGSTYAWTVPASASITSGQGTNSINVNFGASGGTISVTETASCGTGSPVNLTVTTNSNPVTSSITGPSPVCANAGGQIYSVTDNPPNTYNWSVPAGATITAGQGTHTITVDFGATAGTISVIETSACGSGTPVTFNVGNTTIPPVTSPISGPSPVCPNTTQSYSVTNTPGSTYAWTTSGGPTLSGGQGTNAVTVDFGASGGTLNVTETSSCGVGTPVSLTVTTSSTPVTSSITGPSPVCPNATGQIYSVVNTTGSTYNWTVPAGATITAGQTTNSITVNFGATAGTISVTETATCGAGTPVILNVTNSSTPVTSAITGNASVCPNATGQIYSVTNNPPNTYAWTVPAGATITAGQGTNTITVNFAGTSGNVTVTETNTCGAGTPATLAVSVTAVPPVTSVITGPSPVCPNATAQVYAVTNNSPNTYAWTVPSGASITSGQGTNSITVNFGATAGTISVTETSSCGVGTPVSLTVINSSLPVTSAIAGPTAVCANATAQTYSVTNNPPDTYNWVVPSGAAIVSGQGTNSIVVNFGATPGTISVTETNSCGAGTAVTQNITFNPLPTTSVITGTTPVCANAAGVTFSVTNNAPNTYSWTVPVGASITAGQTTNNITVTFGSTSGNVSVTETNTCGNGTPVTFSVTVNSAPSVPVITGPATVCQSSLANSYSVVNTVGDTYNWTVTGGLTIASGQGTSAITADAATTNGTISVTESNTCGASPAASLNITATVVSISVTPPSASVCNGFSIPLTASGATTYSWLPSAGLNVTTGATVNAGPAVNTTYTVTGTTGSCTGTATVAVSLLPDLVITPTSSSSSICTGTSTTLSATGATSYSWSPGTGLSSTSGNSVSANPGSTQTYTVTGTTATCSGTATITLTVTSVPTLNLTPANPTICYGASANIIASGATTYAWAPNINFTSNNTANSDVTVNPTTTTTYTVIGTLGNCNNSTAVTVSVLPQIIPNAGIDDTLCVGQTTALQASGGTTYAWLPATDLSNAATSNPTATPITTTTYTVSVSNGGLCTQTDQVTIHVNPIPSVNAGMDTSINIEESIALHGITNGTVYSWANDGTLNCSVCLNPIATPVNGTGYTLTAYNVFGCSASDVVYIDVIKDYAYYIPNAFSPNGDNLNEVFSVEGFGIDKMELTVFDRWGNKLFTTSELYKGWNGEYKGDTVQADEYVYTCKIHTYSGSSIKKTGRFTVVR